VLCAAGYNIKWLLRMIAKKGVPFWSPFFLCLRWVLNECAHLALGRQNTGVCMTEQVSSAAHHPDLGPMWNSAAGF